MRRSSLVACNGQSRTPPCGWRPFESDLFQTLAGGTRVPQEFLDELARYPKTLSLKDPEALVRPGVGIGAVDWVGGVSSGVWSDVFFILKKGTARHTQPGGPSFRASLTPGANGLRTETMVPRLLASQTSLPLTSFKARNYSLTKVLRQGREKLDGLELETDQ